MHINTLTSDMRRRRDALQRLVGGVLLLGTGLLWHSAAHSAEEPVKIPPPTLKPPPEAQGLQKAIFAGGCFWGVQGV